MARVVEILLYTLKPGTGDAFHAIMAETSVPLHASIGMDVVAYGPSLHDPDAYYLIRAYDDLAHLDASQEAFYASGLWRNGPREAIVSRIAVSVKSVLPLSPEAIETLRREGLR